MEPVTGGMLPALFFSKNVKSSNLNRIVFLELLCFYDHVLTKCNSTENTIHARFTMACVSCNVLSVMPFFIISSSTSTSSGSFVIIGVSYFADQSTTCDKNATKSFWAFTLKGLIPMFIAILF